MKFKCIVLYDTATGEILQSAIFDEETENENDLSCITNRFAAIKTKFAEGTVDTIIIDPDENGCPDHDEREIDMHGKRLKNINESLKQNKALRKEKQKAINAYKRQSTKDSMKADNEWDDSWDDAEPPKPIYSEVQQGQQTQKGQS